MLPLMDMDVVDDADGVRIVYYHVDCRYCRNPLVLDGRSLCRACGAPFRKAFRRRKAAA